FVALAGIITKKTITLKNLDGYEKILRVRFRSGQSRIVQSVTVQSRRRNRLNGYFLSAGWKEFQRNSNISEGDQFVFKFITSEDKFCLAKITNKKTRARPLPRALKAPVTEVDDGMDDKDMDDNDVMDADEDKLCLAKLIKKKTQARPQLPDAEAQETKFNDDDVEDDNDKDENEDPKPVDDVDPFFVVDISTSHKFMLRLPPDFVELAGIDGKKNIIIKCLDGNEIEMVLRPVKQGHSTRYYLSMGWSAFRRSNNISEGDECVFKYITSEDKMSLAKITKKITPPTEVDVNDLKVDDGMDGKDVVVDDNKDEDENVEPVDDGMDGKDVVVDDNKDEDENVEPVDDGMDGKDVVVDDNKDEDENVESVDDGKDVVVDDNKEDDENVEPVDGMHSKDVVV
ncbi:DNA-binding pseudobarrel domain-containing protein, partial [Tanacetum coccineum]